MLADGDPSVTGLVVDVTDPDSVAAAAGAADDVDLVIANAGVLSFGDPLGGEPDAFRRDFETNVMGVLTTARAFAPVLERNGGALATLVTLVALAPMAPMAPYCASKAATHSLTQSLRAVLRPRGVTVHGVYPAGIDTEMLAGVDADKEAPSAVAAAIMDGIAAGTEDIVPSGAAGAFDVYASDPKALERLLAGT